MKSEKGDEEMFYVKRFTDHGEFLVCSYTSKANAEKYRYGGEVYEAEDFADPSDKLNVGEEGPYSYRGHIVFNEEAPNNGPFRLFGKRRGHDLWEDLGFAAKNYSDVNSAMKILDKRVFEAGAVLFPVINSGKRVNNLDV